MNKRDAMMQQIEKLAASNGHVLNPWTRGRLGFYTNCRQCGAHVGITVSRNAQREGERLSEKCDGVAK
jgi:hypothetical protein